MSPPSTASPNPGETTVTNLNVSGPRGVVSIGVSPCTLQNTTNTRIMVLISGGTVTTIEFSRDGVIFDTVGLLGGQYFLNPGDLLKITYVVAPTVIYYPL